MRIVLAALIGFVAILVLEVGAGLILAMTAEPLGIGDLRLSAGPLVFVDLTVGEGRASIRFREGVVLVAIAAGALNAFSAYRLWREPDATEPRDHA